MREDEKKKIDVRMSEEGREGRRMITSEKKKT